MYQKGTFLILIHYFFIAGFVLYAIPPSDEDFAEKRLRQAPMIDIPYDRCYISANKEQGKRGRKRHEDKKAGLHNLTAPWSAWRNAVRSARGN
jgi:hypothetical protein